MGLSYIRSGKEWADSRVHCSCDNTTAIWAVCKGTNEILKSLNIDYKVVFKKKIGIHLVSVVSRRTFQKDRAQKCVVWKSTMISSSLQCNEYFT